MRERSQNAVIQCLPLSCYSLNTSTPLLLVFLYLCLAILSRHFEQHLNPFSIAFNTERTSLLILLSRQQSLDYSTEEYYVDALSFVWQRLHLAQARPCCQFFPDFGDITYPDEGDAFCLTGTVHGT